MPHLAIDLLGPLQVCIDDRQITTLESVKVRALLAYLAVESDRAHTREALVGLLWPDYEENSARHNLRQALFNLRMVLGDQTIDPPYLLVKRNTIQFNRGSDYSLDIEQFNHYFSTDEDNLAQRAGDRSEYVSNLEEMVKLYRGEFLQRLSVADSSEFEGWLLVQRESLHQKILEAHSYLTNYYERMANYPAARHHAMKQLALDPWREEAHRQLMRALALDGDRSAALAQYETCKKVLADELDIEPSAETRELYEQIRLGALNPVTDQTVPIYTTPTHNLPIQLTPFIGREVEIEQLGNMISDPACKCITLVGPGGIGKTRLAVQVAGDHFHEFRDGAAFVSFASVNSLVGVIPAITNAINFSSYGPGDPTAQLLTYLHEKQMLLILDNLEHLLSLGATRENIVSLVVEILLQAPGIKLLVTSREILSLQEEWIFEVQGLAYPKNNEWERTDEFDAITLFYQRARRANTGFMVDDENRLVIARICQLVEGMPLAIELAATWIRTLTPSEIADEIENGLDFLSSSTHDLPERHRSMRVVFDHSWDILSSSEQQVLTKLAVFRGSFQRQAAEQVAGATLSVLSMLLNRTLLRRSSAGRYELHEIIRQYCAMRLAADPEEMMDTQERHFTYYLALAEAADQQLKGRSQLEWLVKLDQEHDNLRAALEWALENDETAPGGYERALRLPAALRWFWRMRGHFHEGYDWLMESLHGCQECSVGARAAALLGISLLMNGLGDLSAARAPGMESVRIFRELDDRPHLAEALMITGLTMLWQGEASTGHTYTREALAIYRELGDRWGEAQALYRLGSYLSDYSGEQAGRGMLEESASILESLGEKYLYTSVLIALGIIDLSHGDYGSARSRFEHGLATTREINHPWGIADASTNLGCLLRIQGEYDAAQACFDEALRVYHEHGRNIWEVDALCATAENALNQGDLATSRLDLSAATDILEMSYNIWLQVLVLYFKGRLAFYEADYQNAIQQLREAIALSRLSQFKPDLARSLVSLCQVYTRQADVQHAKEAADEGLSIFWECGNKLGIVTALEALAELNVTETKYASATILFAIAQSMREELGAVRPPIDRTGYESVMACIHAQLEGDQFTDLWANSSSMSHEQVVTAILEGKEIV